MAFSGKQIKNGTLANAKLANANNTAAADSVVLSKPNSKIDISYIPTDDEILRQNFSYTTLSGSSAIRVPEGQTMLIADDLDINDDAQLIIDGDVATVSQDLINIRPWASTVYGDGTYILKVGRINKYDSYGNDLILYLPASPDDGDVVELKEVGNSSNAVTLTTAAGTVQIENVDATTHGTSVSLEHAKLYLNYKWDAVNSVWRLIGCFRETATGGGGSSSTQIEDLLTTSTTTSNGDAVSASGLSSTPNAFSVLMVYLNGVLLNHISYGNKTGSLYFSNDNGTTAAARNAVTSGTKMFWNGTVAGFELTAGWAIKVVYAV